MGGTIFRFYGEDTAVIRGDIERMGGPLSPPTRENSGFYHWQNVNAEYI